MITRYRAPIFAAVQFTTSNSATCNCYRISWKDRWGSPTHRAAHLCVGTHIAAHQHLALSQRQAACPLLSAPSQRPWESAAHFHTLERGSEPSIGPKRLTARVLRGQHEVSHIFSSLHGRSVEEGTLLKIV